MIEVIKEPQTIEREGIEAGLRFIVVATYLGHRCAYVALPKGHPWREARTKYDEMIPAEAHHAAHGGITWMGTGIGSMRDSFVVGFDAAHLMDAPDPELNPPKSRIDYVHKNATVKTADYMEECARALARVAEQEKA